MLACACAAVAGRDVPSATSASSLKLRLCWRAVALQRATMSDKALRAGMVGSNGSMLVLRRAMHGTRVEAQIVLAGTSASTHDHVRQGTVARRGGP